MGLTAVMRLKLAIKDGAEFVSPIIVTSSKWRDQLNRFWRRLDELCYLETSERCGLHIHISWDMEHKITELRAISEMILRFQPTIDQNFPDQLRVNNPFCRSNNCHLTELRQAQGLNQLIDAMSPARFYAWNFQTLKNHGTIEYRQPPGQVTSKGTKEWVRFVISFIHASLKGGFPTGVDPWNELKTGIRKADDEVSTGFCKILRMTTLMGGG